MVCVTPAAARVKARKQAQWGQKSVKSAANSAVVSPRKHSRINSRCGRGYADHPKVKHGKKLSIVLLDRVVMT
jgi:hypothetical protein